MEKSIALNPQEIKDSVKILSRLLADSYVLYLKTQNYHWNVVDKYFSVLHEFFETQYLELAEAIDAIAERIRVMGHSTPATFAAFLKITILSENDKVDNSCDMISNLLKDHQTICEAIRADIKSIDDENDEGTKDFLVGRLRVHEKTSWMLQSHLV